MSRRCTNVQGVFSVRLVVAARSLAQYKDLVAVAINLSLLHMDLSCQSAHTTVGFDDNKGIAAFSLWRKKMHLSSPDFPLQSFSTCQSILSYSHHAGLHSNVADFAVLYVISIKT